MSMIADGLRNWARGTYSTEAAVELLIRHGKAIYRGAPWLTPFGHERQIVVLDIDELLIEAGAWSSGERRIVDIAASLISEDAPILLNDVLPGLDRRNVALVLAAIAHASGSHEHSAIARNEAGEPTGFRHLPSLFPWPTD